jgi:hypothetical protein
MLLIPSTIFVDQMMFPGLSFKVSITLFVFTNAYAPVCTSTTVLNNSSVASGNPGFSVLSTVFVEGAGVFVTPPILEDGGA